MKRFLIVSEDAGVFIGTCMGMGFFSKWDCAGQDTAVTFESLEFAQEYAESISMKDIRYVEVECENKFIHVSEMVKYGLEPWDVEPDLNL